VLAYGGALPKDAEENLLNCLADLFMQVRWLCVFVNSLRCEGFGGLVVRSKHASKAQLSVRTTSCPALCMHVCSCCTCVATLLLCCTPTRPTVITPSSVCGVDPEQQKEDRRHPA
jgi:hypothetical protein